ncbi:hypothetical protein E2C01_099494 [Portunus trituberculatus]|uniref:Uncharacterized protein n=1 Tax=Portunus trituberculatus TaxID=210409 RepID=A0A5B7KFJ3_PORTR|nr:hypothetical protein [Portunus trituberculatus]
MNSERTGKDSHTSSLPLTDLHQGTSAWIYSRWLPFTQGSLRERPSPHRARLAPPVKSSWQLMAGGAGELHLLGRGVLMFLIPLGDPEASCVLSAHGAHKPVLWGCGPARGSSRP